MADDASQLDGGDEGWSPLDGVGEPDEFKELTEIALLTEVSHPMRSRVIRALRHPRSVAEVAAFLDVPVTRLYHHVNRLEELGFIRVVATRKVAAVTERRYQVVAKSMNVAPRLLESPDRHELALALGSLFDGAKLSFQREVEHGLLAEGPIGEDSMLSRAHIVLTPERRAELNQRLLDLMEDFRSDAEEDDPDGQRYEIFLSIFPATP